MPQNDDADLPYMSVVAWVGKPYEVMLIKFLFDYWGLPSPNFSHGSAAKVFLENLKGRVRSKLDPLFAIIGRLRFNSLRISYYLQSYGLSKDGDRSLDIMGYSSMSPNDRDLYNELNQLGSLHSSCSFL